MPFIADHKQKFADLKFNIENQDQLRRKANGGNSILFSYAPNEENLYVEKARELYAEQAEFIDVSRVFVENIDKEGIDDFLQYYQDFKNTPHLVFKSDDPASDLFDMIIEEIKDVVSRGKIPFLIRTGCLYGTSIENVNIMEQKEVMTLAHPLVIFYPSKVVDDNILFLNFKTASKYRCTLVN